MGRIQYFIKHHPDLFRYQKATEVHLHDRFLHWSVLRFLPKNITPNIITLVRVLLTPLVFFLILYGWYRIGIVLFLFLALTDALDGSLARTKNKVTNFGKIFDPIADKFLMGSMVVILVFQYLNPLLASAIIGIEFVIIMIVSLGKVRFKTSQGANRWGKTKMVLQVIAVFCTLLALLLGNPVLFSVATWIFGISLGFAILSLFTLGL